MNLDRLKNKVGYLAGPMTGHPDSNYAEFALTATLLRGSGLSILNPAEHYGGDASLPREMYLRIDIHAVLSSDYVVLLPDWQQSPGANLEVDVALGMGLPLYEVVLYPNGLDFTPTWELKRIPAAFAQRPPREEFDPTKECL